MSELPKDWRMGTLRDLARVRNGYAFKSSDFIDEGVPLIRQSNLVGDTVEIENAKCLPPSFLDEHPRFTVKKGDVLIGMSGSIGKLSWYRHDTPALQNQRTGLLEFEEPGSAGWVCYFLNSVERQLNQTAKGVAVQNISGKEIEALSLPLPPLPEQRRIVARIEELFSRLDAGVAALRHAKAQLQRYRQSVLAAAVTGQLTQAWREQHPDTESAAVFRRFLLETRPHDWTGKYSPPIAPALEKRYEIPDSWTWMSTDELIREPLKNGLSLKGFTDPPGVAVLKLDALNENGLDYSKRQYLRTDSPKVAEIQIEKGDFLISRGNGSLRLLAKGVIADVVPDNVIYPDTMIRFRFPSTVQRWISIAWRSRVLREQIETRAKSTAGIYKIAQGDLRPIAIPIPPLAEQHQIVAEVEARTTAINRLEDELESKLRYATKLRQSILKSAFLGIL